MKQINILNKSQTNMEYLNTLSDSDIDFSDIPEIKPNQFNKTKIRNNLNYTYKEPYLGLEAVVWLDKIIIWSLECNSLVTEYTHTKKDSLNPLQCAACQIIPQGINISLSIRELIRSAYLFSALVLIRPLIERSAILSFLQDHPEHIKTWESGWKYNERPALTTMLSSMYGSIDVKQVKNVCAVHNHLVHGDPISSYLNLINQMDGSVGYTSGKILNQSRLCKEIAMEAQSYLIILTARMSKIFPAIKLPELSEMDENLQGYTE